MSTPVFEISNSLIRAILSSCSNAESVFIRWTLVRFLRGTNMSNILPPPNVI